LERIKTIDLRQTQPLITNNNWKSQTLLLTTSVYEPLLGLEMSPKTNCMTDKKSGWPVPPNTSLILLVFS
jgi:hypothetical protein